MLLDVGLSEGLKQSGVAECKWAIEINETVAEAFKLNNEDTAVYINSCEDQLKAFKDVRGFASQVWLELYSISVRASLLTA